MGHCIIFLDFNKAYDSVRRDILYNILIEFHIPMNLVWLTTRYSNEKYSRVGVGKYFSDTFTIMNGLK